MMEYNRSHKNFYIIIFMVKMYSIIKLMQLYLNFSIFSRIFKLTEIAYIYFLFLIKKTNFLDSTYNFFDDLKIF